MDNSANRAAEIKYHTLKPWLFQELGNKDSAKTRQRTSRNHSKSASSHAVDYQSIPAICFTRDSQHLVTAEFATPSVKNCKIHIFNKKGYLLNSFPTEVKNRAPPTYGVASTEVYDTGIAICTGDGLEIWNSAGQLLSKMTGKDIENCCHVTGMNNGLLATTCITEMKGRCVSLWDPRAGKMVGQFGSRPEVVEKNPLKATHKVIIRINDIRLPWFLAANSRNEILISDRNARCIKTFDARNGFFVKSFDIHGIDARCKNTLSPQGLCIDEDDNLLVVDNLTRSLQVFDRYGEHATTMTIASELEDEPWALSMTTEQFFTRPMMRSRVQGNDNTRTMAISMATPDPIVRLYKLSICPHYTEFI